MAMTEGAAFRPSRRQLSNRGFISQLKLWGFHEHKVSGDWTTMQAPHGDRIKVRSAHTHTGNSQETYTEALRLIPHRPSWDEFVARGRTESDHVLAHTLQTIKDEEDFNEVKGWVDRGIKRLDAIDEEIKEEERARQRAQKARRKAAKPKKVRVGPPREDTEVQPEKKQSQRGRADAVFGVILRHPGPITNAQIAAELPQYTVEQVGQSANDLYRRVGVIDRVKRGVWQRRHEYSAHDMTIDVVSRNIDLVREAAVTLESEPKPTPAIHADRKALMEDRDELLNDVLDNLFPDGVRMRHLSVIERWKTETSALIDLIEEDR